MARKRWVYTNAGKPLPEPIEVDVESSGPAVNISPNTSVSTPARPPGNDGGVWSDTMFDQIERRGGK